MNTKPDPPDGDGLSREQITEYIRELNTIAAECEIAGTAELSRAAHNLYRIAKQWFKSLPTRDAAEGACQPYVDPDFDRAGNRRYWEQQAAPPKPAPDVREALRERIGGYIDAIRLGATNEGVTNAIMRDVDRLSASVPLADRATGVSIEQLKKNISDEWGSHLCYRNSTTTERFCAPEHCRCADIARAILASYSLSPPCAGAAEPVATPQQVQEACAQVADRAAGSDEAWAAKYSDEAMKFEQRAHRAKTIAASIRAMISPVVAPPVRGDREAIAQVRYVHGHYNLRDVLLEGFQAMKFVQPEKAVDDMLDAILSLPVQSGAGEREAAIEQVSKRLVQMAANMGGMHAPELKRLARAIRQAPHFEQRGWTVIHFRNKIWEPQSFAICMAFDAFRIALGGQPQHFTLREVIAWLAARSATTDASPKGMGSDSATAQTLHA